jgi:hypothetical protein
MNGVTAQIPRDTQRLDACVSFDCHQVVTQPLELTVVGDMIKTIENLVGCHALLTSFRSVNPGAF